MKVNGSASLVMALLLPSTALNAESDSVQKGRFGMQAGAGLHLILPGVQVGFTYGLTDTDSFTLSASVAELKTDGSQLGLEAFDAESYNLSSKRVAIDYKRNVWSSLYLLAGLSQRSTTGGMDLIANSDQREFEVEFKADGVFANIGVGNQLLFDNGFYLDIQWASIGIPLSKKGSTELNNQDNVAGIQEVQDFLDDRVDSISRFDGSLFVTSLGYRF